MRGRGVRAHEDETRRASRAAPCMILSASAGSSLAWNSAERAERRARRRTRTGRTPSPRGRCRESSGTGSGGWPRVVSFDWVPTRPPCHRPPTRNRIEPMDRLEVAHRRLHNQHLSGPPLPDPAAVVRHLGASQAQEYAMAKWSLGQRSAGADDAAVQAALDAGTILRTHVLRPTWHFVAPEDIRWMLALTGPRVRQMSRYYERQVGDRRRPRRPRDGRPGRGAPGRQPPDAPAGAGRAGAAGDRGERRPARLPGDGGRAGSGRGQRGRCAASSARTRCSTSGCRRRRRSTRTRRSPS